MFQLTNGNGEKVVQVTAAEYYASVRGSILPRPEHSAMDLSKNKATGPSPLDWEQETSGHVRANLQDGADGSARVKAFATVQRVVFGKTHGAIDVFVHIFYLGLELRGSRRFLQ